MKKPRGKVQCYVLIAAVLLLIAFGVRAAFFSSPTPPTFAVAEAVRGNLEDSVLACGTMNAIERVNVGAQATGQLKSLKVARGVTRADIDAFGHIDAVVNNAGNLRDRVFHKMGKEE